MTQAHPLQWPAHWRRSSFPRPAQFKVSLAQARYDLYDELERLGATKVVISSNMKLNLNGQPSATQPWHADRGVAVYFARKGNDICIACDKWDTYASNVRAIGKTVEAIRGIERWGTSEMVDAAFLGYAALPAGSHDGWWTVLGLATPNATRFEIEAAWRDQAKRHHPDAGGDSEQFRMLQDAYQQALTAVAS